MKTEQLEAEKGTISVVKIPYGHLHITGSDGIRTIIPRESIDDFIEALVQYQFGFYWGRKGTGVSFKMDRGGNVTADKGERKSGAIMVASALCGNPKEPDKENTFIPNYLFRLLKDQE